MVTLKCSGESYRNAERNGRKPWLTGSCPPSPLLGPLCWQSLPPRGQVGTLRPPSARLVKRALGDFSAADRTTAHDVLSFRGGSNRLTLCHLLFPTPPARKVCTGCLVPAPSLGRHPVFLARGRRTWRCVLTGFSHCTPTAPC